MQSRVFMSGVHLSKSVNKLARFYVLRESVSK